MKTLRESLADADARHAAIGHFNISDLATLKAIFGAAQAVSKAKGIQIPILIGVSEGEREFVGVKTATALVKSLRAEFDYPIYLNADHTHSLDKAKAAAEAGFDEVIFDLSSLPMDQNIAQTKEAVIALRAINPEIVIEGEIGYIGSNSEIVDVRPESSLTLSTPEEAITFMQETGIDVLAPAVGNMHGLLKSMAAGTEFKHLNIERIAELKKAISSVVMPALREASGQAPAGTRASSPSAWMTLHGGSGTADEDFVAAVKAGMTIVHVSSELRLAWRRGMEKSFADQPNEIAPYKLLTPAIADIQKIVEERLNLFNS